MSKTEEISKQSQKKKLLRFAINELDNLLGEIELDIDSAQANTFSNLIEDLEQVYSRID